MILKFLSGNLVALPGRAFLLSSLTVAFTFLASCQKESKPEALSHEKISGLGAYSESVGAGTEELHNFNQSLAVLKKSDGSSSADCLELLIVLNQTTRNSFLKCLTLRGLSGLNKEFLEELVGIRLSLIHAVHDPESAKTLKLLNWIFDLSLEQYALSNPSSYWLEKKFDGKFRFIHGEIERKNHDDYNFLTGDIVLSISPTELSTLIPQYSYPQRRLTHSMIYRGAHGNRKEHFIESEFEEGVRYKYRDIYRDKDKPYETIVLRYTDPSLSLAKLEQIRKDAADFAASQIGIKYGFTTDPKDGYPCHLLTGLSYAEAAFGDVLPFLRGTVPEKRLGFEDLKLVLTEGFSPMRQGLSRNFSTRFGMAPSIKYYPTAGDFLTSHRFDVAAVYIRPDSSKRFSDFYTVAESVVDSMDRGSVLSINDEQREKLEPLLRDRHKLTELIGMARKLKRHSIFRRAMSDTHVSVERLDEMTVEQLKLVLDRLDKERHVLIRAAKSEIGLNALQKIGIRDAFDKAINLRKKELEGVEEEFSMGDFLIEVQHERESAILEFREYLHTFTAQSPQPDLVELIQVIDGIRLKMDERHYSVTKVTDGEYESLRKLLVKIDFRELDKKSDHKEIDRLINRIIVGFEERDFRQLEAFIENLDFEDFKNVVNFGEPAKHRKFRFPTGPNDLNFRTPEVANEEHFITDLPVMGAVITKMQDLINSEKLEGNEKKELVSHLRVYARFLLSIPSLKKKLTEYDDRPQALQDIIKSSPYIASALENDTLIEFGLYKKLASGVVDKLDEIREKQGITQLWQMPPWLQRSWIEFVLSQAPVMRYVP